MAKSVPVFTKSKASRATLAGPAVRAMLPKLVVGEDGEFVLKGRVRSLSSNDYEDSVEMEMKECEMCEDKESLSSANRRRKSR